MTVCYYQIKRQYCYYIETSQLISNQINLSNTTDLLGNELNCLLFQTFPSINGSVFTVYEFSLFAY